ncbi:MAG: hypothetical protein Q8S31_04800 [Alphaproteobacteria bacterium]|nr:hypothetical protein [Alphaproteobacteria bacterium]
MNLLSENKGKAIVLYLKFADWIWISDQAIRNRTLKREYLKKLIKEYASLKKNVDHSKWELKKHDELKAIPVELDLEDWIWISNQATRSKIHKKEFFTNMISEIINEIKIDPKIYSIKIVA